MKEKVINFFNDIGREMQKVTWPTRDELMESTKIVIIITLAISLFTYFVDLGVSKALQAIL